MAQLIDILKVTIDPVELAAKVRVADDAPLKTSDDPEATARVLELVPGLVDHVCLGDDAPRFGNVIDDTELAHLLEHLTVELLAKTELAGDISCGRTEADEDDEHLFTIRLACPDDVLTVAALSSAEWIIEWAYNGGGEPAPDIDAIVSGLVGLIESLDGKAEDEADEEAETGGDDEAEAEAEANDEAEAEGYDTDAVENDAEDEVADVEPEAEPEEIAAYDDEYSEEPAYAEDEEVEDEADDDDDESDGADDLDDYWNMDNIPAPRPVR